MTFKTEQESFWAGGFGTEYIQRNQGDAILAANLHFFAKALPVARGIKTCIEFGANIGMSLKALKLLHPHKSSTASKSMPTLLASWREVIPPAHVYHISILDFSPDRTWDLGAD